ncbi:MAG: recombinase family protein [Ktedonobacterales bacterium]
MAARKLRALGYIRQSRASEAAASPEAQRQAIASFCKAQGWHLVDVFEDIGRSGFDPRAQRPGLAALLAQCERGGVQRVLVYKLDRLTRRGIVEALDIVQRIEAAGAALVSITEPLDTSSALGQGIFALLLSLAQAESEKLSERVRGGKNVSRARGGWQGGPTPYGFALERVVCAGFTQSRLVLDPERAPIVQRMVDDVLAGKSIRSIADALNAQGLRPPSKRGQRWTHATVAALLRSPVIAGYLPDNAGDVLRNPKGKPVVHGEPLVDADTFRRLQRALTPRAGRKPQQQSLLGGLARCAGCGGTMGGDASGNGYRCSNAASGKLCDAPARVPMSDTDEAALAVGAWALSHPEVSADALRVIGRWWALRAGGSGGALEALSTELDEVKQRRARLRDLYVAGDFDNDPEQYRKLYDATEQRHTELTERVAELNAAPIPPELMQPGALERLDIATQRELLSALLVLRCHKAARPGVTFKPVERLSVELVTGESLELALQLWAGRNDGKQQAA